MSRAFGYLNQERAKKKKGGDPTGVVVRKKPEKKPGAAKKTNGNGYWETCDLKWKGDSQKTGGANAAKRGTN